MKKGFLTTGFSLLFFLTLLYLFGFTIIPTLKNLLLLAISNTLCSILMMAFTQLPAVARISLLLNSAVLILWVCGFHLQNTQPFCTPEIFSGTVPAFGALAAASTLPGLLAIALYHYYLKHRSRPVFVTHRYWQRNFL